MKARMSRLLPVLPLCLLLSACGGQDFDPQVVKQHYGDGALSARYRVVTHDSFFAEYCLEAEGNAERMVVTIREPQSVAGVSAVLQEGRAELQYEDAVLDALTPEIAGCSPMDALYRLMEDLSSRTPGSYALEKEAVTMDFQETVTDGRTVRKCVELEREGLALCRAEIYLDENLLLTMVTEDFCWNTAG